MLTISQNVCFAGTLNYALKKGVVGLLHENERDQKKTKNKHLSLLWEAAFLLLLVDRNSTELHISFHFIFE